MSDESCSPQPLEDRLFDRLVDGEMEADERRRLLAALDDTADGWRRCALAYVAAQAWRQDLRGAGAESPGAGPAAIGAATGRSSVPNRLRRATGIAAAVMLAFAAGWLVRPEIDGRGARRNSSGVSVAVVRENDRHVEEKAMPVQEPVDPELPPGVRLAGVYQFELDDRGQARTVAVPVLEGRGIDPRWLLAQPPAIAASAVQALERRGHRVEAHRELLTVSLKDGRKLILPVDEIGVRFANRVFQ